MRLNATVQYVPGQIDDEGRPVSTEPFTVEFESDESGSHDLAITETGEVQFDWVLLSVTEATS